jgi:hypothetical protein
MSPVNELSIVLFTDPDVSVILIDLLNDFGRRIRFTQTYRID